MRDQSVATLRFRILLGLQTMSWNLVGMPNKPYRDFNSYLRRTFGCRVQKISLDAGLGCPNRDGSKGRGGCIYCNSRGSGTGKSAQGMNITHQLAAAKSALYKRYKATKYLAYFQSYSNTYAPLPVLKRLYSEALADPDVVGLCLGTRPDCVPDPVLDHLHTLSRQALVWMEYGLQSAREATLQLINRGHGVEAFVEALTRTRDRGLPVCAHVILGLPGEGREEMLQTARFLARCRIEAVKVHLLYVIEGTKLHEMYRAGKYRCLEQQEYVELVGEFLSLLPPETIVQRLTGDPHRSELVAPDWALQKKANLQAIIDSMHSRGLYQGKYAS